MRILHVIESLGRGGAERMLTTLAVEQRRRHDVSVVSLTEPTHFADELRRAGVVVTCLGLSGRKDLLGALAGLTRAAMTFRPQVVHAHLLFAELYAAATPTLGGVRVATFHNMGPLAVADSPKQRAVFALEAATLRSRFDVCVAVSDAAAQAYRSGLGLHRVSVVPNPVDLDAVRTRLVAREEAKRSLGLGPGPLAVVVAKHTPEKAIDSLLTAIATLDRGTLLLALVGAGPLTETLKQQAAALGIERDLRWVGEVSGDDVTKWFSASDVVVMPSRSEGLPVTLLEAMAAGRPVVATRVGGIPEVVVHDESALLVEPDAPRALAAAIVRVLNEPGLGNRLVTAAAQRVESFSPTHVAAAYEALYREALSR